MIVPVTLTVQGTPAIIVAKTVGTVPGVCAATSTITVPMGTTVYYCYTVTNTGDVTLNSHTLVDDKLGTIFTNFAYALTPGSSVNTVAAGLSIPAVINVNTTNVATWTAAQSSTGGLSATATATARVNIVTLICNDAGENFDAAVPPLGWTVVSSIPAGPQWTTIAGCGELGNYASGNGGAACASGLNYPDGTFDTELRTPPFSLAGWTGGTLNFKLNFQSWAGIDRLSVDISQQRRHDVDDHPLVHHRSGCVTGPARRQRQPRSDPLGGPGQPDAALALLLHRIIPRLVRAGGRGEAQVLGAAAHCGVAGHARRGDEFAATRARRPAGGRAARSCQPGAGCGVRAAAAEVSG